MLFGLWSEEVPVVVSFEPVPLELFLFFLCFFFPVVVLLWSVPVPEFPELVPLMSPEPVPLEVLLGEDEDWEPCGEVPVPGEEVPDCWATAMPIENRAAVAIARSLVDIDCSPESTYLMAGTRRGIAQDCVNTSK